tara:strand:+ start:43390 stop:45066 length:1677 start_codon:yes stop_codon:yes gene_type:complete
MSDAGWHFLSGFSEDDPLIVRASGCLSARDLFAAVSQLVSQISGSKEPLFLYCEDAGNFLVGLLAALQVERDVLLPGHAASGFLSEIGADAASLMTDVDELPSDYRISLGRVAGDAPFIVPAIQDSSRIGFFTSGSTGVPKLCLKSQEQLISEVAVQLDLWGAPSGAVIGTVSHQHIYGLLFRVLWPLMAGKPFHAERQDIWEGVGRFADTECVIISSPAHLSRIPDLSHFVIRPRYIFSSGGPLSFSAALDAAEKFEVFPIEVLGSTETGGVAWRQQTTEGAVWAPLPLVEIGADAQGALMVHSPFAGGTEFVVMGDQVKRLPDGRFSLHARLDRIVKVEGKRVSLPRVEEAMRSLPGVYDAACVDIPSRKGALGAIVVLQEKELKRLADLGPFRLSRQLRSALGERLEPMERPRYWRFVQAIPTNAQGKRPVEDLRILFEGASSELPTILDRQINDGTAQFSMLLNADLCWFEGHFPEQPILPGVAQLHIASLLAEDVWGFVATGAEMARVKFRRVMQPNDLVTLTLSHTDATRVDFRYLVDNEITASGTIKGIVK